MEQFKEFLSEQKNTHMTHLQLEDSVIYGGVNGTRQSINALRELRNLLAGEHEGSISIKWDGCVSGDTKVVTNEGIMTLREIYDSWHTNRKLFILAKDEITNLDIFTSIEVALASTSEKDWVTVQFAEGEIVCTPDHEIKTVNRGWVPAGSLDEGDDVEISENINKDGYHHYLQIGEEYVQIKRRDEEEKG